MDRSEIRGDVIPDDLDAWVPGPFLAAVIATVDRSVLSGHDLVVLLRAEDRLISHYQAGRYQSIAEIGSVLADPEVASSEVGVALHLTRAAADTETGLAEGLAGHPQIREALGAGLIDLRRARVLVESLGTIDQAQVVLDRVLPQAPELTTGQLRARTSRILIELDAQAAHKTYLEGLERRRVVVEANPDGTANLCALNLPPARVMAIRRRLNRLSREARTPGDTRTHDQRRADTLLDLLTGKTAGNPQGAGVEIVADINTLTGISEAPGHLPGWGPVHAELTRKIVSDQTDTQWRYTVTDQGRPVATGTLRRRPTVSMTRRLRALHPVCVFPGCRIPTQESDLDHHTPWRTTKTTRGDDLAPLCRHHHQLKDQGWRYRINPDHTITWTSPLHHTYTTSTDPP
jgi:hypothetical protein